MPQKEIKAPHCAPEHSRHKTGGHPIGPAACQGTVADVIETSRSGQAMSSATRTGSDHRWPPEPRQPPHTTPGNGIAVNINSPSASPTLPVSAAIDPSWGAN